MLLPTKNDSTHSARRQRLTWFLVSTFSAAVGRHGYFIICAWALVEIGLGSGVVAAFLLVVSVSEIVASLIAGIVVDRYDRLMVNAISDVVRTVAIFCATVLLDEGLLLVVIGISAVVMSVGDRLSLTASQALVATLSETRGVETVNSWMFGVTQLGNLGAACLAGLLLPIAQTEFALAALIPFFAISAGALLLMRRGSGRSVSPGHALTSLDRAVVWRWLPHSCAVYALLYGASLLISVLGSSLVLVEQRGDATDFAIVEAAWSIGSIVGTIVLPVTRKRFSESDVEIIALAVLAVAMIGVRFVDPPWSLAAFFSVGAAYQLGRVNLEASLQQSVPIDALGRAKGIMHSTGVGVGLVVFGIATAYSEVVMPSTLFMGFGSTLLSGTFLLRYFRPPRGRKDRGNES